MSQQFSEQTWVWKNPDWMLLPDSQFKLVQDISCIDNLLNTQFKDSFPQMLPEALLEEITASWAIESISLRPSVMQAALEGQYSDSQESMAVQATKFFLESTEDLSVELILKTHKILDDHKKLWGKVRKTGVCVQNFVTKKILYIAPAAKDVPKLLHDFVNWWHSSKTQLPLPVGAALAHLYFAVIHPFEDGNGRISRLLANKYLGSFPPYSISAEIYNNHATYYHMIREFSNNTALNFTPFVDFILTCHKDAANNASVKASSLHG